LFASIFYFLFHLCFLSNLLFFLETPPFFFFALHLLCISNNSFPSLTFIPSFRLSLSCIYRRSRERATPT
jgi:hypothetical protein